MGTIKKNLRKAALAVVLIFSSAAGTGMADRQNKAADTTGPDDLVSTQPFPFLHEEFNAAVFANTPAGTVCVKNVNTAEMQQTLPRLSRDFNLMAQLPLTGRPVYDFTVDSRSGLTSCIFQVSSNSGSTNTYSGRRITIASNTGTSVTFHESFHASQDRNGYLSNGTRLTQKDAAVSWFLTEASAVAYEMAARQEAKNRGLKFTDTNTSGRADDPANKQAFNSAYKKAWKDNANLDAGTREAKALEAGGKAVVRRLLGGWDTVWNRTYVRLTISNLNIQQASFCADGRERRADYKELRRTIYTQRGYVSSGINFIPDELLGPDADTYIDQSFRKVGLKESQLPPPPKQCPGLFTPKVLPIH